MRIAVYRSCGIGDAVQITPLLQQIRADLPEAEVSLFTSENVASLFENCPWLDRCVGLSPGVTIGRFSRFGNPLLWNAIRQQGPWSMLLNLGPGWKQALFSLMVPAEKKAGFVTPGRKPLSLYTHPVPTASKADRHTPHISSLYLDLWSQISGFRDRGFGYEMRFILNAPVPSPPLPERFLCLAPGSGNFAGHMETKRWPAPYWTELSDKLRCAGWPIVWLGNQADRDQVSPSTLDINLMGKTDLPGTAHVITRSHGLIGNDSGMFHLALGLQQRAAAFFGPTSPVHVGPFRTNLALVFQSDLPCVPCHLPTCQVHLPELGAQPRPYCMTLFTPDKALAKLLDFFSHQMP